MAQLSREEDFPAWEQTTEDLMIWGEGHGLGNTMMRETLAWLSFQELAHYDHGPKCWVSGPPPDRTEREIPRDTYEPEASRLLVRASEEK